jgi:catechol-2,3-dioxygenase
MPGSNQTEGARSVPSRSLGHVVLNVRSLAVSTPFYCEVLGLKEVGRNAELRMVFLSFGINDHDIGLCESERTAHRYDGTAVGLGHVAFLIGKRTEELRSFKAHLEAQGISITRIDEHVAGASIYLLDPDGIELEAYIEHPPETRRGNPQAQRFARPIQLD